MTRSLFKKDAQEPRPSDRSHGPVPRSSVEVQEKPRHKRLDDHASLSVIGVGMEVEGEIKTRGDIQIEGLVKGSLSVEGQISITGDGVVDGDLTADRVVVAGKVHGSVTARESTRLVEGARLEADVKTPRLEVEDGATLNGRVEMGDRSRRDRHARTRSEGNSIPSITSAFSP